VRKFIRKVLKMSSSCWTPVISSSQSTVLLKFRTRAPLKKLRNLSLSLRRGPWRFWRALRASIDWSWREGVWRDWLDRAATTGQVLVRMLAWCEEVLKEKKRSLSRHSSVLGFFKQSSVTHASPRLSLHNGDGDIDQCLSTVVRPRPGKFFFNKTRARSQQIYS